MYPIERDFEAKKIGYSATSYIDVLDSNLGSFWQHGHIFMQGNAPIHKAKSVSDWLEDQAIEVLSWPPYSPDLNPIENLWAILKDKALEVFPEAIYLDSKSEEAQMQLFDMLEKAWEAIDQKHIDKLVESMPRRIKAIIAAEGWHTKY